MAHWPPDPRLTGRPPVLITSLLFLTTLFVAYANGANDNFKGVATLYGSGAATYKTAIALATVATLAGSLSSVYLATALMQAFSGMGLVPAEIAASPDFVLAAAAGAGATVLLATLLGLPVSTTHALTGALTGTGLLAAGTRLDFAHWGTGFLVPLVLGPVLAVLLTIPFYRALRVLAGRFDIKRESCICVGAKEFIPIRQLQYNAAIGQFTLPAPATVGAAVGTRDGCVERYQGRLLGVSAHGLVNALHYLSAGIVSFARGLNDTPKIAGLLLVAQALNVEFGVQAIATAMAAGGLLNARKVALTMSKRISRMNEGQALAANMVTGLLVILASRFGLPVSTTHVSVGAISGIGIMNGSADKGVLGGILASWLLTLPVAAIIGALIYALTGFFHLS
ncbi:MAG TPA: inorganic phosphate transporter [Burkholderiales bacterium]|nr:inorganic phosphate transporter [Burkholderiales bacterium]